MFGFLNRLFDRRCELADRCDGYQKGSVTCDIDQRKGDGGIYCGKLREYLDSKVP